jgi:hypothetical protein
MRFYDWMQEVAKQFLARTGIDLHDLPDLSYRDWFDTGMGMEAAINNIELEFS